MFSILLYLISSTQGSLIANPTVTNYANLGIGIRTTAKQLPCCADTSLGLCYSDPDLTSCSPSNYFYGMIDSRVLSFYGCSTQECNLQSVPIWTALTQITVSESGWGNCSIASQRIISGTSGRVCSFHWVRSIQACGSFYCYWDDSKNQIAVECTGGKNMFDCEPPKNGPSDCSSQYNPVWDIAYYQ